jgi:hypothetical protein
MHIAYQTYTQAQSALHDEKDSLKLMHVIATSRGIAEVSHGSLLGRRVGSQIRWLALHISQRRLNGLFSDKTTSVNTTVSLPWCASSVDLFTINESFIGEIESGFIIFWVRMQTGEVGIGGRSTKSSNVNKEIGWKWIGDRLLICVTCGTGTLYGQAGQLWKLNVLQVVLRNACKVSLTSHIIG